MQVVGGFSSGWTQIWHFKILINHRPWRAPASRGMFAVGFMSVPCHSPTDRTLNPAAAKYTVIGLYGLQMVFKSARRHRRVISDAISHDDFNRILYRYEIRPSNIVEFCSSCWKMAKNAPFDKKSSVKNFHGRVKGGHRTVPPLNTPLHKTYF